MFPPSGEALGCSGISTDAGCSGKSRTIVTVQSPSPSLERALATINSAGSFSGQPASVTASVGSPRGAAGASPSQTDADSTHWDLSPESESLLLPVLLLLPLSPPQEIRKRQRKAIKMRPRPRRRIT